MKLKYFMRGLGLGVLLSALIISFANTKEDLTDQEIMKRAAKLGMVNGEENDQALEQILEGLKSADVTAAAIPGEPTDIPQLLSEESDGLSDDLQTLAEVPEEGTDNSQTQSEVPDELNDASQIQAEAPDESSDTAQTQSKIPGESSDTAQTQSEVPGESSGAAQSQPEVPNGPDEVTIAGGTVSDEEQGQTANNPSQGSEPAIVAAQDPEPTAAVNNGSADVSFTIIKGMSSDEAADVLAKAGLVGDAKEFNRYIIDAGKASVILPGNYTLPANATYEEIMKAITAR